MGILEVFGCLVKYFGFLQKSVNMESGAHDIELTNEPDIENGNDILNRHDFVSNYSEKNFIYFRFQIRLRFLGS